MLAKMLQRWGSSGAVGPAAGVGSEPSRLFSVCWSEVVLWIHTWLYLHFYFCFTWFTLLLRFHIDS